MTENCRVKIARFFAGTDLPALGPGRLGAPSAAFAALAASIRVTMICSRRSAATAASIVSATRSPVTDCPARVRPEYANVGIESSQLTAVQLPATSFPSSASSAPGRVIPAPGTTPAPRLIICSSSSFSDDAPIADSSVMSRF